MRRRRVVTGRRIAVALTVLVIVILAAPVSFLHFSANRPPPPPQAYLKIKDALVSVLWPLWLMEIYPCTWRDGTGENAVLVIVPTDQCFKMQPQRRFSGVWLDQFEGSIFLEGVTEPEEALRRLDEVYRDTNLAMEWLDWSMTADELDPALRSVLERSATARLIHLEFEGRRTAYRGRYGHLGMSESEVIVDRVISARPVHVSDFNQITCEMPDGRPMCE